MLHFSAVAELLVHFQPGLISFFLEVIFSMVKIFSMRIITISTKAKNHLPTWLGCLHQSDYWCQRKIRRRSLTSLLRTDQAADVHGLAGCLCSWGWEDHGRVHNISPYSSPSQSTTWRIAKWQLISSVKVKAVPPLKMSENDKTVVVSVSDLRSRGLGFDSRPVHRQAATLGKLLTPMCLCHQAVQFGTGQGRWCSVAGKVTVGLASHWPCITDLWFIHLRAHRKGDEHPTNALDGVWSTFYA